MTRTTPERLPRGYVSATSMTRGRRPMNPRCLRMLLLWPPLRCRRMLHRCHRTRPVTPLRWLLRFLRWTRHLSRRLTLLAPVLRCLRCKALPTHPARPRRRVPPEGRLQSRKHWVRRDKHRCLRMPRLGLPAKCLLPRLPKVQAMLLRWRQWMRRALSRRNRHRWHPAVPQLCLLLWRRVAPRLLIRAIPLRMLLRSPLSTPLLWPQASPLR